MMHLGTGRQQKVENVSVHHYSESQNQLHTLLYLQINTILLKYHNGVSAFTHESKEK